ncbi:MAG: aminoacyl-tRNA hydrolase [Bacteroidia bacterium]
MRKAAFFGLGNPGPAYERTRHNIGFSVVDFLRQKFELRWESARYAYVCQTTLKGLRLYLFQPTTYMNLSGKAVAYYVKELHLSAGQWVVITDEIQLPLGVIRLSLRGSSGGHNGLQNIIETLSSTDFLRLRIGIGKNFPAGKQVEYVLSPFSQEEERVLPKILAAASECLLVGAQEGWEKAMSRFNGVNWLS